MNTPFTLTLSDLELGYLVNVVRDRITEIADTECNNPTVRLELYAEMGALRAVLEQLEGTE